MIKKLLIAVVFFASGALLPAFGCGDSSAGCPEFCKATISCCLSDPNCNHDSADIPACVSACEDLSAKDDDYRDAVDERGSCYEGLSCDEIRLKCAYDES